MAYGVMPKLGEPVTCDGPCEHRDCAATRAMAATPCHYCGKVVEAGDTYYLEEHKPVHFLCAHEAVEQGRMR